MSEILKVKLHSIEEDGLPTLEQNAAFIFSGCIVSGWPLFHNNDARTGYTGYWEADSDVGRTIKFGGVTHWIELPFSLVTRYLVDYMKRKKD